MEHFLKIGDNRRVIVVLGMHRSGTSAITRGLQVLGASLGENLMPPAVDNNEKGFFEDIEINALNIQALHAIGSEWFYLVPITSHDVQFLRENGYILQAVELLRKKIESANIFAFKDPRIAKISLFWNQVIEHLQLDVSYVIALRHPLSVVKSLEKRDGFFPEHSYFLWLDHVLESLRGSTGKSRVLIDYDRLIKSPDIELSRLADAFHLHVNHIELEDYKNNFLDPALRHTVYSPEDLLLDAACPPIVYEVFTKLLGVASGEVSIDDPSLQREIAALIAEFDRLKTIFKLVDKQHNKIATLGQAVAERDGQIATLGQAVAERDGQIATLGQAVAERDGQITGLENETELSKVQYQDIQKKLNEASKKIENLHAAIQSEKESNACLNNAIFNLVESKSWKVTAPMRKILSEFYAFRSFLLATVRLLKEVGLREAIFMVVNTLRDGGFQGLKRAVINYMFLGKGYDLLDRVEISGGNVELPQIIARGESMSDLEISSYEIISFDVFDTALIRLVHHPIDIFAYIENSRGLSGFADWRSKREAEVRANNPHLADIHLDQIYENDHSWMNFEILAEQNCCVANPEVYEIYRKALVQGKAVVFVSDMYLPLEDIKRLLSRAGYLANSEVFVSSEDKLVKGNGSRFASLAKRWVGKKVLHIGDNVLADYEWPKKFGFSAFHYQERGCFFAKDELLAGLSLEKFGNKSLNISHLLGFYRYWSLGARRSGVVSFWRSVGFLFGGPLLFGFVRDIYARLESDSISSKVYFLARDGDVIKKVYEIIYPESKYATCYLYASRRCMSFPLFCFPQDKLVADILRLYALCPDGVSALEVFQRIGVEEQGILLEFYEELNGLEAAGKLNERTVKAALEKNIVAIKKVASQELESLQKYLEEEGFFEEKSLLIDVGWSGTIQDCLKTISESREGVQQEVFGLYLGVVPHARVVEKKQGYLFGAKDIEVYSRARQYLDFIELLTSSPLDSVKKMNQKNGFSCEPEYFLSSLEELDRQKVSRDIQQGVMEYAGLMRKMPPDLQICFSENEFFDMCDVLRSNSSDLIRENFAKLKHATLPGGGYGVEILKFAE